MGQPLWGMFVLVETIPVEKASKKEFYKPGTKRKAICKLSYFGAKPLPRLESSG